MGLRELADLREDTAESCKDLARIELSFARGTPFPLTLPQVVSAHRLAFSRDGLAQAREALARATGAARAAPGRSQPSERAQPLAPPSLLPADESPSLVRAAPPSAPEQSSVTQACEKFLSDTDPLARDLGAWLLERHSGARAIEHHDLLAFL